MTDIHCQVISQQTHLTKYLTINITFKALCMFRIKWVALKISVKNLQIACKLGTCKSAVCVRIEYESNWLYIPLNTIHDGPMYCSSTAYICCALRELHVVFVTLSICKKNLPRPSKLTRRTRTRRAQRKLSLPIFECQHTVTLGNGQRKAVWVG